MGTRILTLMILLIWIPVGCTELPPSPSPRPTATPVSYPKQPEPSRPLISGQFLGLPDNTLVTFHVRPHEGQEVLWGTTPQGGYWEAVVTSAAGADYVVTAEADGYVSQPVSYTIHLSGDYAYVVKEGQVTDEEAIHLDFHFIPKDSP